jgi:hypothetical protein
VKWQHNYDVLEISNEEVTVVILRDYLSICLKGKGKESYKNEHKLYLLQPMSGKFQD